MATAFSLFLALAATAHGTLIDVNAPGFTFTRAAGFAPLNGMQCNGQSLSADLVFSNSVIVPQGVSRFEVGFELHTGTPFPGFILGTGFVLGSRSQPAILTAPMAARASRFSLSTSVRLSQSRLRSTLSISILRSQAAARRFSVAMCS